VIAGHANLHSTAAWFNRDDIAVSVDVMRLNSASKRPRRKPAGNCDAGQVWRELTQLSVELLPRGAAPLAAAPFRNVHVSRWSSAYGPAGLTSAVSETRTHTSTGGTSDVFGCRA
jgi:hypothetical protein